MKNLLTSLIVIYINLIPSSALSQNFALKYLGIDLGVNTLTDKNIINQGLSSSIKFLSQTNYFAGGLHISYNTVPYMPLLPKLGLSYSAVFSALGGFGIYTPDKFLSARVLSGLSFVTGAYSQDITNSSWSCLFCGLYERGATYKSISIPIQAEISYYPYGNDHRIGYSFTAIRNASVKRPFYSYNLGIIINVLPID